MPPVINALLATGALTGARRGRLLELVIGMAVYLPFMRISEKAIAKQEALAEQNALAFVHFHPCGYSMLGTGTCISFCLNVQNRGKDKRVRFIQFVVCAPGSYKEETMKKIML